MAFQRDFLDGQSPYLLMAHVLLLVHQVPRKPRPATLLSTRNYEERGRRLALTSDLRLQVMKLDIPCPYPLMVRESQSAHHGTVMEYTFSPGMCVSMRR